MKKTLLFTISLILSAIIYAQPCTELFISEYVEGSGNNKAIEIYNPTDAAIDLSDYRLVRYSNGGTTPNAVNLAGTIAPKDVYVVVLEKLDPNGTGYEEPVAEDLQAKADTFLCPVYEINKMMYFNGNDAVTLEKDGGNIIVDIFARVGSPDPDNGWTNITDTTITYNSGGVPTEYTIEDYIVGPLFWLAWTKDHTLIRKTNVTEGVISNPDVFMVHVEWDSIPENSFENLGSHDCECNGISVPEILEGVDISFYPNPVTGDNFVIEAKEEISEVIVFNTAGQTIMHKQLNGVRSTTVQTAEFKTGVYFVKVSLTNKASIIKKIIRE